MQFNRREGSILPLIVAVFITASEFQKGSEQKQQCNCKYKLHQWPGCLAVKRIIINLYMMTLKDYLGNSIHIRDNILKQTQLTHKT